MNFFVRTALAGVTSYLAKNLTGNLHSQPPSPSPLLEIVDEVKSLLPKAVNYLVVKTALALVFISAFFAFFSEALRQIDAAGTLYVNAMLIGNLSLVLITGLTFAVWSFPKLEKEKEAEIALAKRPALVPSVVVDQTTEDPTNVERLRSPGRVSATDFLFKEMRQERDSFLARQ